MKIEWACPKCGALPNSHGKGGEGACKRARHDIGCGGFLCECMHETARGHGSSFEDPCESAVCDHCGWGGTFPQKPRGLQAWERKALDAGWTPPASRKKELKL